MNSATYTSARHSPRQKLSRLAQAACLCGALAGGAFQLGYAQPAAPGKAIVLDVPVPVPVPAAATPPAMGGVIVPTPVAVAVAAKPPAMEGLPANQPPTLARRQLAAASLADLGLHLVRQSAQAQGNTRANAVVSPFSVASTLGMLHAGAAGHTASEIAGVLEPAASGGRLLSSGLVGLSTAIKGDATSQWLAPNRIWVGKGFAKELSPSFLSTLKSNYGADGALVDFAGAPDAARASINDWASNATQKQIAQLLPAGSIKATSKMVLTNAAYFKGQWAKPFDPALTRPAPFWAQDGVKNVPTMQGAQSVREGTIDNIYVLELPFEGGNFSMLLAMPPAEHTVQALENDVMGVDMASWANALKPQRVLLSLPKFDIAGAAVSLNDALKAAGMQTAFGNAADFSGVTKGTALSLDSVFHSAAIRVNEEGTTASAATAAVAVAKSLPMADPPLRAFNRPFVFVLLHKPTGTPLFLGRVAQP